MRNLINYNPHLADSFSPGIPTVNQFGCFELFLSLKTTSKPIGDKQGEKEFWDWFLCVDDVA